MGRRGGVGDRERGGGGEAKLRFNLCATESFQLIKLIDFRVKIHRNGHRGTAKYHLIIRLDLCKMDIETRYRDKKGPY